MLDYITSPGVIIPTLLLLILMICYYYSLTNLLRESTEDLKKQLYHERTEGRRKLMADRKGGKDEKKKNISQRWQDILPQISASNSSRVKSQSEPGNQPSGDGPGGDQALPGVGVLNTKPGNWTSKEQQILRKIRVLERPSVSSINPTSLRMLTPSPLLTNEDNPEDLAECEEEDIQEDEGSSTDNKDVTELEEDIAGQSVREIFSSELRQRLFCADAVFGHVERPTGTAPKIWISKSASMEHDLN